MSEQQIDPRAPMAAAPMRYAPDGAVDWGNMWETFCALAATGGPAHRTELLTGDPSGDLSDPLYLTVVAEIIRGVTLVSGFVAEPGPAGWVAVHCPSAGQARWLAEAILAEQVDARHTGTQLLVPAAAYYSVKGEVKSVITVVAKTTHYWHEHLPAEVRHALVAQERFGQVLNRLRGLLNR